MKTKQFMRKPSFLVLLFYNFLIIYGVSGIIKQEISLERRAYNIVYFHETGTGAVYAGSFFIILALVCLTQYIWSSVFALKFIVKKKMLLIIATIFHFTLIVNQCFKLNLIVFLLTIILFIGNTVVMFILHRNILKEMGYN